MLADRSTQRAVDPIITTRFLGGASRDGGGRNGRIRRSRPSRHKLAHYAERDVTVLRARSDFCVSTWPSSPRTSPRPRSSLPPKLTSFTNQIVDCIFRCHRTSSRLLARLACYRERTSATGADGIYRRANIRPNSGAPHASAAILSVQNPPPE